MFIVEKQLLGVGMRVRGRVRRKRIERGLQFSAAFLL